MLYRIVTFENSETMDSNTANTLEVTHSNVINYLFRISLIGLFRIKLKTRGYDLHCQFTCNIAIRFNLK